MGKKAEVTDTPWERVEWNDEHRRLYKGLDLSVYRSIKSKSWECECCSKTVSICEYGFRSVKAAKAAAEAWAERCAE